MAKLPGIADLGPAPTASPAMPVASYDTSAYASGAQALAQGQEAEGAGIEKAGQGGAALAEDKAHWEYAKANSWFHTSRIDLDSATAQDTNYGPDSSGKTLPQRYQDSLNSLRDQASAMIGTGPMRDLFAMRTAPVIAESNARIATHAKGLENNAAIAWGDQQGVNLMNKAVAAPDDETRRAMIDAHNELVDGLLAKNAITPEQAFAQKQAWAHQFASADALHRADTDPLGIINELRAKPGSDAALIERIVRTESNGDPHARAATSSAYGVAQFLQSRPGGDQTWAGLLKQYRPDLVQGRSLDEINDLRADPNLSRDMLGHLIETNRGILQKSGIDATPGALYLTHFLGPAGAVAVLKADPGTPVASALAKAVGPGMAGKMVQANQSVLGGKLAGTVTQWANGKMGGVSPGGGSIYDILRPDVREELLQHAQARLVQNQGDDKAAQALEAYNVKTAIGSDVASMAGTGQGIDGLDPVRVRQALGPVAAAQWQADRQDGRAYWTATSDKATLTDREMDNRLKQLEPQPGADNFLRAERVHDAAAKTFATLRKQRDDDPGGAVDDDPLVKKLRAAVDPQNPQTVQALADARMSAQGAAGIPEAARSPISKAEALEATAPLRRMLPGEERDTVKALAQQFQQNYGKDANTAFAYALRVHKVDAETSQQAARVMRKLATGEPVAESEARDADQADEIAAAEKATTGLPSLATPSGPAAKRFANPGRVIAQGESATPLSNEPEGPNLPAVKPAAMQYLLTHPETAGDFDKEFNRPGLGKEILGKYGAAAKRPAPAMPAVKIP